MVEIVVVTVLLMQVVAIGGEADGGILGGSLLTPPFNWMVDRLWQMRFSTISKRWQSKK